MTAAFDETTLRRYFGSSYGQVAAFADLLRDQGPVRGLIGPREIDRMWERHILNSAAVAQYLPEAGTLVDVGSGAGLPGVVIAAMRPEQEVVLVEPMERRTAWLSEVTSALALANVRVVRGRAEQLPNPLLAAGVTARAVAPMERLARWCLPLVAAGGVLAAVKGRNVRDELPAAQSVIRRLGGTAPEVLEATTVPGADPTYVVRIRRERAADRRD